MQAIRNILHHWPGLWRYPNLLVTLERVDTERTTATTLAKGLIDGLASPRSPQDCLLSLLDRGEFQMAERVLGTEDFKTAIDLNDYEALCQELDMARHRAADDIRSRIAVLGARASRVGLPSEPPADMDSALDKRITEAQALLDGWEDIIQRKENEVADEMRRSIKKTLEKIDEKATPGITAWQASVERCLKAREYEIARFLVASRPAAEVPEEPLLVPRRPQWPWHESLVEVLQWFDGTQSSPPEFHARWRHDPTDVPAAQLLNVLSQVANSGAIDIDSAREFANALDSFLGRAGMDREVIMRGNWFETRLHAPIDLRLPCFARYDSVGVRLWIPRTKDASPLDELESETSGLCFQPDENVPTPIGIVSFDSWILLRLFADASVDA